MGWVCSNCSSTNAEESICCCVCGCERPTDSRSRKKEPEVVEGKIVFSTFGVMKESVKDFFGSFVRIGRKIRSLKKERPVCEARKEAKAPCESGARVKKPKKEKRKREKNAFAKPWPEHNVKFDEDAIKIKGFVRCERAEMNAIKGYTFYTTDGMHRFMRVEMLVVMGMAIRL